MNPSLPIELPPSSGELRAALGHYATGVAIVVFLVLSDFEGAGA